MPLDEPNELPPSKHHQRQHWQEISVQRLGHEHDHQQRHEDEHSPEQTLAHEQQPCAEDRDAQ